MKQTRNFAEFWSSLFAEAQVTYLTFIYLLLLLLFIYLFIFSSFGKNEIWSGIIQDDENSNTSRRRVVESSE
jgi:hypothetical protein